MSNEWCTIESDPGVFSELVEKMGVKDLSVEEIITMDDRFYMNSLEPIHGFIFLFRWDNQKPYKPERSTEMMTNLFFAKQVITNNCATQALLSVLLNQNNEIDLGKELSQFKEFTMALDPLMRGEAIGQCGHIRKVHNSFAKPDSFLFVRDPNDKSQGKKEDAFHFVSYIRDKSSGNVYELDGLRQGPILLGKVENEKTWIDIVVQEVQDRMKHYISNEIRFALLAVVDAPLKQIKKTISSVEEDLKRLLRQLMTSPKHEEFLKDINFDLTAFETNESDIQIEQNDLSGTEGSLNYKDIVAQLNALHNSLLVEKDKQNDQNTKKEAIKLENARRKHNFIPFIFELLKLGVEEDMLNEFYNEAKQK